MIQDKKIYLVFKMLIVSFILFSPNESFAQSSRNNLAKIQLKKKPNVLIIYTDDQGTLDMNIYGAHDLYTPNMDELARNGIRFTQFYAAAPICSPSRASLLTGRYPQRAGLPFMAPSEMGHAGMPTEQITIAEMFKSAGYITAQIGKWHLGYTPATMPNEQGFDYSFGFMGGCIDNYSHYFYWQGPNRHDLWRNGKEIWEDGKYFPDLMVEEAKKFLKDQQRQTRPFFLYWAINIPHYPLQGEEKWRKYYKDLPSPRNKYAAFVSTMDEKIGQVLNELKKLGLSKNTIVIFQSDQGHSKEVRAFGGGGYAGPYRGSKFSLFEGGIRVPAIISWPDNLPQNEVRSQLCTNIDWLPTLSDLCRVPLPSKKIDGKSLISVIKSAEVSSPHSIFFWQSGGDQKDPQWAVRDGKWKLLHNPIEAKTSELNKEKFFLADMESDSSELVNLSDHYPEIVDSLKTEYTRWIKEVFTQ